jgi:hypothetical protein
MEIDEEEQQHKCGVLECRKPIKKGDTYYLLGGGKVINCEHCACYTSFTLMVGKEAVTMLRGWDKTSVAKNIKKTM